jgi:hypothetical protein
MMREGWICPRCKLALAPHINFCDCRDKGGEAGRPAVPIVTPSAPAGGISLTSPMPYTVTNTVTYAACESALGDAMVKAAQRGLRSVDDMRAA